MRHELWFLSLSFFPWYRIIEMWHLWLLLYRRNGAWAHSRMLPLPREKRSFRSSLLNTSVRFLLRKAPAAPMPVIYRGSLANDETDNMCRPNNKSFLVTLSATFHVLTWNVAHTCLQISFLGVHVISALISKESQWLQTTKIVHHHNHFINDDDDYDDDDELSSSFAIIGSLCALQESRRMGSVQSTALSTHFMFSSQMKPLECYLINPVLYFTNQEYYAPCLIKKKFPVTRAEAVQRKESLQDVHCEEPRSPRRRSLHVPHRHLRGQVEHLKLFLPPYFLKEINVRVWLYETPPATAFSDYGRARPSGHDDGCSFCEVTAARIADLTNMTKAVCIRDNVALRQLYECVS